MVEWPFDAREPILFIEDDDARVATIEAELASTSFRARFAESGEAALWGIAQSPPSMVVIDLDRPVLDGWFVLADVGSRPERPRLIAVSRDEADRMRAIGLGADQFVIPAGTIGESIAHILELSATTREPSGRVAA